MKFQWTAVVEVWLYIESEPIKISIISFVTGKCSCYDSLDDEGYGKCQKGHPDTNNLAACYVSQPSNCSDAKHVPELPGRQISSYACKSV